MRLQPVIYSASHVNSVISAIAKKDPGWFGPSEGAARGLLRSNSTRACVHIRTREVVECESRSTRQRQGRIQSATPVNQELNVAPATIPFPGRLAKAIAL